MTNNEIFRLVRSLRLPWARIIPSDNLFPLLFLVGFSIMHVQLRSFIKASHHSGSKSRVRVWLFLGVGLCFQIAGWMG